MVDTLKESKLEGGQIHELDAGENRDHKASNGPIGVDVGTCKIVVCQREGDKFSCASKLNAFFVLPYRKFTQDLLDKNEINYFLDDGSLVIFGDEAEKVAAIMDADIRRPMCEGLLNSAEPGGQKVIHNILASLIVPPKELGETLCLAVPAVPESWEPRLVYHEAILKNILMAMGYRVRLVNEGLATVLAALEDVQFNGIGISLGAGMCNGCLAFLSIPVVTFGYPRAGDYIDHAVASVMDMLPTEVRHIKESELDLSRPPSDRIQTALHIFYEQVIRGVLTTLQKTLQKSNNLPRIRQAVPLVLSGGSAIPQGFLQRFEEIFGEFNLPVAVSEIRLVEEPLTATARGALKAAVAEELVPAHLG